MFRLCVHTRCAQGGDAAAQLLHYGGCHFFGFVGDNPKFDCGLEAVGHRFIGFALYVRFKDGKHNWKQVVGELHIFIVEDEERCADNQAVDDEQNPSNTARCKLLLDEYCQNITAASGTADLKGKYDCHTDAKPCGDCSENAFCFLGKLDDEIGEKKLDEQEPQRLEKYVQRRKNGKFFLDVEEGQNNQGCVQHENECRQIPFQGYVHKDGDAADAADSEVVGGNQAVCRNRHQKCRNNRVCDCAYPL